MFFRRLNDETGYLFNDAMAGFGKNPAKEKAAAEEAIDQALRAAAGVETLNLDLRFNEGGWDGVALASRFADRKRLPYTKQARQGNGFRELRSFHIEPAGSQHFSGKVIVLTSRFTVSAAEIFVLAMRTLPNVTVAGETTAGALSDMLERHLPNGWTASLSNEIDTAADGKAYEHLGLPPGIRVPLDLHALAEGRDRGMETLLVIISQPEGRERWRKRRAGKAKKTAPRPVRTLSGVPSDFARQEGGGNISIGVRKAGVTVTDP